MTWSVVSAPDLSEEEFSEWQKMLEEKLGIFISDSRKQFLQSQIAIRMRELGETRFSDYFSKLNNGVKGKLEWSTLVDRLVVKETAFFRHQPSYDFLQAYLRDAFQESYASENEKQAVKVLSLGCATGEEAYSLAMSLNEMPEFSSQSAVAGGLRTFRVIGVDVSVQALNYAQSGIYTEKKMAFVPLELRKKYFAKKESGDFLFKHEVSSRLFFICKNIIDFETSGSLNIDVVFCQNLLIYFEQKKRKEILNAIVQNLKVGAVLILGLGEVMDWRNPLLERFARADVQAYRRVAG